MSIFARIGVAMKTGGYADFKEFADTAVAAGFHDDENINIGAFIEAGSPRPATTTSPAREPRPSMTRRTRP